MKIFFSIILNLLLGVSFGQSLTTIKVSVPNKTDDVFIVGGQESIGNWQPDKVKMNRVSDYEREISLQLKFPAEFKFTRGNWDSEAIITKLFGQKNLLIKEKPNSACYYVIKGWTDQIESFSTFSEFKILDIDSKILNQKRRLYVSLPENYNQNFRYPVIYVTDANILSIFEIVVQTLRQQSNFYNFPECIVVGININIKERNKELDIVYGENGKKFKNYIFNEIIPFVDRTYSTSLYKAIFGHSNGAEFNHYLMFEKDNPFDAYINISENLTDLENGKLQIIKNKYTEFLKTNEKSIKYFIASAKYDDPNRLPSGLEIEKIIRQSQQKNLKLKHNIYKSWHVDLIGHSTLDAFKFIFSDYQDYSIFEEKIKLKDFNYKTAKEKYFSQNSRYIQPYIENDASSSIIFEIIKQSKKSSFLKQYLDNEDKDNEIYNFYVRAILFYEINDLKTSLNYLDKMISENDQNSIQQLINSKAKSYFDIYRKVNRLDLARKNLETIKIKNPDLASDIDEIKEKLL